MEEPTNQRVKEASLLVMLDQLNERGRWYSGQLWQIPFAHFGIVALIVSQSLDGNWLVRIASFVAAFVFGTFVWRHTSNIQRSEIATIGKLIAIEEILKIPEDARARNYDGSKPLVQLVQMITILTGIAAVGSIVVAIPRILNMFD